ncbi:MAG: hypothetical protein ACU836_03100 [Gammaproteobacteria bacterium]
MKQQHLIPALCLAAGLSFASSASQANLLGLAPNTPTINFAGGIIEFTQQDGTVTISGLPSSLNSIFPFISAEILGASADNVKDVTVIFTVDNNGTVISNDPNVPDLVVYGSIDTNGDGTADYSGALLSGEVVQFGFENGAAGGTDSFDLRLNNIGGSLAYLYSGQDLAITVQSEASPEFLTPFEGGFTANWMGAAKGNIGSTAPITGNGGCHMALEAKCSVDGGPFQDKCRIKVTRSPKHWERIEYTSSGHIFYKSQFGMHGSEVPTWAANYPSTNVTFQYTLTNDGDNPVSQIEIYDSFSNDTPMPTYPTLLSVGSSFTITRAVELNEAVDNDVTAIGTYGSEMCVADDVIVVKNKLRDRKKHDDDDFRDKGNL